MIAGGDNIFFLGGGLGGKTNFLTENDQNDAKHAENNINRNFGI